MRSIIDKFRNGTIIVKYPPDFDGELHIEWEEDRYGYKYQFAHAGTGTEWDTLVEAARGILAQDQRMGRKWREDETNR